MTRFMGEAFDALCKELHSSGSFRHDASQAQSQNASFKKPLKPRRSKYDFALQSEALAKLIGPHHSMGCGPAFTAKTELPTLPYDCQ